MSTISPEDRHTQPEPDEAGQSPAESVPAEEHEDSVLDKVLRSAGSDAMRYVPVRFLPAFAALISVPIFTAAIGAEEYGAYYLISSVAVLGSSIAVGWLGSALVRFYWPMKREKRLDEFIASVLWSALAALLAVAFVFAAVSYLRRGTLTGSLGHLVPAALAFFVVNYLTDVLAQLLRASKRAKAFAVIQVSGALLSTGIAIALVWWGHFGAAGIFAGGAIAWTIMLFPILRTISAEGSLSPSRVSPPLLKELWMYGMPLVPVGVSLWALGLIDRWVIQVFAGTAAVGLYSVAYSLGDKLTSLVTAPLILTMSPSLMEAYEHKGQAVAEKVQTQFVRYFALITLPLLAGLAAAAEPIMHVFTAQEYWVAWPVLPVVSAAYVCSNFSQVATAGLAIHKKTHLIMVNTLTAAIFNLVANLVLVPRFGYMAAAYNTVAAYFLMMLLSWRQTRRYMELRLPWADLGRITAASVVMGVIVSIPDEMLLAGASRFGALVVLLGQVVAGTIIYTGVLLLLGGFREQEISFVRGLLTGKRRAS